jgi:peptide/nickel transport system permease protein
VSTYIARRIAGLFPVMLVVAIATFVLIHLAPGDPAGVILGPDASAEDVLKLQRQLGLDLPIPLQLTRWLGRLVGGDLGDSIFLRRPVTTAIMERLEPTLVLTTLGTLIAIAIGIPIGILSASRHNTALDQASSLVALLGLSIPNFLLGLLLVLVFAVWLGWLPVAGYVSLERGLGRALPYLILPSFSLGFVQSALIARITRSSMLDVLREQYITVGRAKGLPERLVIYKHALRNAIIPTLTVVGITFAILIGGSVVIETVFNIPGLGRLIISSVLRRDYPMVQGIALFIALTYMLINLLVDILYAYVDPRVRYE